MASFFSHVVKVDYTIFDKVNNEYQSSVRESIFKCSYFHLGPLDTDTHRIRIKQLDQNLVVSNFFVVNENAMIVFNSISSIIHNKYLSR